MWDDSGSKATLKSSEDGDVQGALNSRRLEHEAWCTTLIPAAHHQTRSQNELLTNVYSRKPHLAAIMGSVKFLFSKTGEPSRGLSYPMLLSAVCGVSSPIAFCLMHGGNRISYPSKCSCRTRVLALAEVGDAGSHGDDDLESEEWEKEIMEEIMEMRD
ncbi:hypothetical protein RRG08_033637 [Elysia crispata]|uniref:Uncharacterized protein n=1 Tax=Elysia crispata TaxID=231223 RepID=A0AAE0XRA9_9GAST|nr:hypothetical protein RRG08_033637 [Elysia crispata]